MNSIKGLKTVTKNVKGLVEAALDENGGLLRLAPCWVPRSFLQPGKRLKLHPDDLYAFGLNRGGIDERWFASTAPAANENRTPDEGLSYVVAGRQRFTLQQTLGQIQEVAGLFQILRQHGTHAASHASKCETSQTRRPGRQTRILLFP